MRVERKEQGVEWLEAMRGYGVVSPSQLGKEFRYGAAQRIFLEFSSKKCRVFMHFIGLQPYSPVN